MYNRAALEDLFDYTTFTWESYGRSLKQLPPDALTRPIAGSGWSSLWEVLVHLAVAWDEWLRDRLGLDNALDVDAASLVSWDDIQAIRERTRGWLKRVLEETADEELHGRAALMFEGTAAEIRATAADILAHMLLHERGHHGDISTLLVQLGAMAPNVDYIVYLWFKQRRETG
ncbi:MAG: DinB family protein [Dehalococcoidia bacterium]